MHDSPFLLSALAICSLLTLATAIYSISKALKIPFAVGLLISGLLLSSLSNYYDWGFFRAFNFSPDIVFYVFLPTLIFESAYHLNIRHFRGVIQPVIILATVGLLISTFIVGFLLNYLLGLPIFVSLLFGALISATDPVAVLAIFRELKAPKRLETIVDGESLINDATALILFQFFGKIAAISGAAILIDSQLLLGEVLQLFKSIFLGIIVGSGLGLFFLKAIAQAENKGIQLTLSFVLAHVTFLISEGLFGASGILATMMAGLIVGNLGKQKLKGSAHKSFAEIWGFLGFISNALIFLLLGLKLGELDIAKYAYSVGIAIIVAIFIARPVAVFGTLNITNLWLPKEKKITFPEQFITNWGGIRGALAAAAVLLIPESYIHAEKLQAMTAGVIVATFIINGTTTTYWLRKLKIITFSRAEKFQRQEAKLLINEEISDYLDRLVTKKYISEATHGKLKSQYKKKRDLVLADIKNIQKKLNNDQREFEKILSNYALGIEYKTYKKLFALEEVSESRFVVLKESIHRQRDRLKQDVLPDERQAVHKYAPEICQIHPLSKWLNRFGCQNWAQKLNRKFHEKSIISRLQHYRARRISSWKVVQDFAALKENHPLFTNSPVVDKIIKRYEGWNTSSEKKMHALEKQYPLITEPYRMAMAERSCLNKERMIEREFFDKGLISEKVYEDLEADLGKRTRACRSSTGTFKI